MNLGALQVVKQRSQICNDCIEGYNEANGGRKENLSSRDNICALEVLIIVISVRILNPAPVKSLKLTLRVAHPKQAFSPLVFNID